MDRKIKKPVILIILSLLVAFAAFACNLPNLQPRQITDVPDLPDAPPAASRTPPPQDTPVPPATVVVDLSVLDIPTQEFILYDFLPYTVQAGDTLPALAARFRTNIDNLLADNPALPSASHATTLEPGMPLSIRLVVIPFWEPGVLILPNTLFVNGPSSSGFDTGAFLAATNGWLKDYVDRSGEKPVTGQQIVDSIVNNYSISPRLVLTLLEYELHALSDPEIPRSFNLGNMDPNRRTLGSQLSWAANALNNGYYGWRNGAQTTFTSQSGFIINPNPWQNAATVAVQYYYSKFHLSKEYKEAVQQGGFLRTYQELFGPVSWDAALEYAHMPGGLQQPGLRLPFLSGRRWALTAGPHSGWGAGHPWAAIDFAPPAESAGCTPSDHWAVAMASGLITRAEDGLVIQDLDDDGDSRTGWVIFYLHIHPEGSVGAGEYLSTGQRVGHPSCVGGHSTGRNLHIARLYNGEWIPAGGVMPFNLSGWVMLDGMMEYKGELTRGAQTVYPSNLGVWSSQLTADP